MSKEIVSELRKKMTAAFDVVHKDFSGLRTGRASPNLLKSVLVDAYGNRMHINQVGNINVPEPRLLTVQVWDADSAPAVEKSHSRLRTRPQSLELLGLLFVCPFLSSVKSDVKSS